MSFERLGDWRREEHRNLFNTESDPKEERRAKLKKAKKKTGDLTAETIKLLNLTGFVAWRNNNIPSTYMIVKKDEEGNVMFYPNGEPILEQRYKKNNVKKGTFDIIGFRKSDGRHLEIEIKVGKDKLSPEQSEHLKDLRAAEAIAFIVSSIDTLLIQIKPFTDRLIIK